MKKLSDSDKLGSYTISNVTTLNGIYCKIMSVFTNPKNQLILEDFIGSYHQLDMDKTIPVAEEWNRAGDWALIRDAENPNGRADSTFLYYKDVVFVTISCDMQIEGSNGKILGKVCFENDINHKVISGDKLICAVSNHGLISIPISTILESPNPLSSSDYLVPDDEIESPFFSMLVVGEKSKKVYCSFESWTGPPQTTLIFSPDDMKIVDRWSHHSFPIGMIEISNREILYGEEAGRFVLLEDNKVKYEWKFDCEPYTSLKSLHWVDGFAHFCTSNGYLVMFDVYNGKILKKSQIMKESSFSQVVVNDDWYFVWNPEEIRYNDESTHGLISRALVRVKLSTSNDIKKEILKMPKLDNISLNFN